jgi:hypothetical protein
MIIVGNVIVDFYMLLDYHVHILLKLLGNLEDHSPIISIKDG